MFEDEAFGSLVAGRTGVLSACDVLEMEGVDPGGRVLARAGGGEEGIEALHIREFEGQECVDGANAE